MLLNEMQVMQYLEELGKNMRLSEETKTAVLEFQKRLNERLDSYFKSEQNKYFLSEGRANIESLRTELEKDLSKYEIGYCWVGVGVVSVALIFTILRPTLNPSLATPLLGLSILQGGILVFEVSSWMLVFLLPLAAFLLTLPRPYISLSFAGLLCLSIAVTGIHERAAQFNDIVTDLGLRSLGLFIMVKSLKGVISKNKRCLNLLPSVSIYLLILIMMYARVNFPDYINFRIYQFQTFGALLLLGGVGIWRLRVSWVWRICLGVWTLGVAICIHLVSFYFFSGVTNHPEIQALPSLVYGLLFLGAFISYPFCRRYAPYAYILISSVVGMLLMVNQWDNQYQVICVVGVMGASYWQYQEVCLEEVVLIYSTSFYYFFNTFHKEDFASLQLKKGFLGIESGLNSAFPAISIGLNHATVHILPMVYFFYKS